MKIKFTLIDYIIIILVIIAVVFAFIHITSDDSASSEKTAFDESTINKIPDTYLKYYKDGFKVKSSIDGFNSTNNERITVDGDIIWIDNNCGNDVKLLIQTDNNTYLAGFYRYVPNADIYIDHISLESDGEKYKNLVEIKANPKEITSLNDLIKGIDKDCDFEISTKVSLNDLNKKDMQKVINKLDEADKRMSIKTTSSDMDDQLVIVKATKDNINDADSILGNIDGVTNDITIRIYNSSERDINSIENSFDVFNIKRF